MRTKRLEFIKDIKTLDDLKRLKLKKKYEVDLKRLELQSSFSQLQMRLQPESIRATLAEEAKWYLQGMAVKWAPAFLLKLLSRNK